MIPLVICLLSQADVPAGPQQTEPGYCVLVCRSGESNLLSPSGDLFPGPDDLPDRVPKGQDGGTWDYVWSLTRPVLVCTPRWSRGAVAIGGRGSGNGEWVGGYDSVIWTPGQSIEYSEEAVILSRAVFSPDDTFFYVLGRSVGGGLPAAGGATTFVTRFSVDDTGSVKEERVMPWPESGPSPVRAMPDGSLLCLDDENPGLAFLTQDGQSFHKVQAVDAAGVDLPPMRIAVPARPSATGVLAWPIGQREMMRTDMPPCPIYVGDLSGWTDRVQDVVGQPVGTVQITFAPVMQSDAPQTPVTFGGDLPAAGFPPMPSDVVWAPDGKTFCYNVRDIGMQAGGTMGRGAKGVTVVVTDWRPVIAAPMQFEHALFSPDAKTLFLIFPEKDVVPERTQSANSVIVAIPETGDPAVLKPVFAEVKGLVLWPLPLPEHEPGVRGVSKRRGGGIGGGRLGTTPGAGR